MIRIEPIDQKWSCEVANFSAPLQKGLRFKVAPAALKTGTPPASEMVCRLVDWHYQITDAEHSGLVLVVEEEKKPLAPERVAEIENRTAFRGMLAGIGITVAIFAFAYNCYLDREYFWAVAGHYGRWAVGLALFAIFSFILPVRLGLNRRVTIPNFVCWAALNLTGFILIGLWIALSRYPVPFEDTPHYYAQYARALVEKFSTSYWPVLLAGLPWVAVAFKLFGLERAEKTVDALREAAKKGD